MAEQSPDPVNMIADASSNTESLIAWAALGCAILIALAAHWVAYKLLLRTIARDSTSTGYRILIKTKSVSRLAFVVVAVQICLPLIALPPSIDLVISRLITLGLIAIAGWLAVLVVSTSVEMAISRHRIDIEDNLEARKVRTRLRVLRQAVTMLIFFITIAAMLMTFPGARSLGLSLFASAGVAGIVVGFAARPVLSNLLAGLQIALTQPIRIDDAVVIEGEWGWIEEITPTYVVVKIWDWRRLIVPLSHVIEHPFQNWTRESASIIGSVIWHTDYTIPIDAMRNKLKEFLEQSAHWDGDVQVLQVIDANAQTLELRALMSAKNSPTAWDLRCEIREKMIRWLQQEYPHALPHHRAQIAQDDNTSDAGPNQRVQA